jgi:pyruvate dehydrogenase (quinone)
LTDVLGQAGTERVYTVVGDSLNPVVDAIRRTDRIEWIHVRNKEAGAFHAEAQLTGRLAVRAGQLRPRQHAPRTGLYDAHRSGPVLSK